MRGIRSMVAAAALGAAVVGLAGPGGGAAVAAPAPAEAFGAVQAVERQARATARHVRITQRIAQAGVGRARSNATAIALLGRSVAVLAAQGPFPAAGAPGSQGIPGPAGPPGPSGIGATARTRSRWTAPTAA